MTRTRGTRYHTRHIDHVDPIALPKGSLNSGALSPNPRAAAATASGKGGKGEGGKGEGGMGGGRGEGGKGGGQGEGGKGGGKGEGGKGAARITHHGGGLREDKAAALGRSPEHRPYDSAEALTQVPTPPNMAGPYSAAAFAVPGRYSAYTAAGGAQGRYRTLPYVP